MRSCKNQKEDRTNRQRSTKIYLGGWIKQILQQQTLARGAYSFSRWGREELARKCWSSSSNVSVGQGHRLLNRSGAVQHRDPKWSCNAAENTTPINPRKTERNEKRKKTNLQLTLKMYQFDPTFALAYIWTQHLKPARQNVIINFSGHANKKSSS